MKKLILLLTLFSYFKGYSQTIRDLNTQDFDTYDIWLRPFKLQKKVGITGQVTPTPFLGNISMDTLAKKVGLRVFTVMNIDNTLDINKPLSTAMINALALKANANNAVFTGTTTGITKSMIGLGLADNTSDINKPISLAVSAALSTKAPLSSPVFSGDVEMSAIGNGVIIKSPNGTRFRITISNTGDIIATSL